jgi:hypothetical protein
VHLREVNEDDYGWVDVAGVVDIVQVPSARSFGWLRRLGGLLWLLGDAGRTECFFVVTTSLGLGRKRNDAYGSDPLTLYWIFEASSNSLYLSWYHRKR